MGREEDQNDAGPSASPEPEVHDVVNNIAGPSHRDVTHVPQEGTHLTQGGTHCPRAGKHSPQASTHIPQASTHIPQASTHIPQASTHIPQASTHIPQASTHIPQASTHIPQASTHILQASTHCPRAGTHIPQASTHCPRAGTHIPQASTHCPRAGTHSPQASTQCPRASTHCYRDGPIPQRERSKLKRPREPSSHREHSQGAADEGAASVSSGASPLSLTSQQPAFPIPLSYPFQIINPAYLAPAASFQPPPMPPPPTSSSGSFSSDSSSTSQTHQQQWPTYEEHLMKYQMEQRQIAPNAAPYEIGLGCRTSSRENLYTAKQDGPPPLAAIGTPEEQFRQLYELSDDPRRKEFLDDLFQFMSNNGSPITRLPIMAKSVLDLYELYNLVVQRGGLVDVINKKLWQEIIKGLHLPSSITSAAFTLRTQYMKYLYLYECAKNQLSTKDELNLAIDGNRRESRRGSYGTYTEMLGRSPTQMIPLSLVTSPRTNGVHHAHNNHHLLGTPPLMSPSHHQSVLGAFERLHNQNSTPSPSGLQAEPINLEKRAGTGTWAPTPTPSTSSMSTTTSATNQIITRNNGHAPINSIPVSMEIDGIKYRGVLSAQANTSTERQSDRR